MDPLAKLFPWNSVYAFAEGDVIRSIDLEGGEKLIVVDDQASQKVWKSFLNVISHDDLLYRELFEEITKQELEDKIHIYYSSHKGRGGIFYGNDGITFTTKNFLSKWTENIIGYETAKNKRERARYDRSEVVRYFTYMKQIHLDKREIYDKIQSNINIFYIGSNSKDPLLEQELAILHEIYLHLKKYDNMNNPEDHVWGYGKAQYADGSNKRHSPSYKETDPTSRMGKIQRRYIETRSNMKDIKEKKDEAYKNSVIERTKNMGPNSVD
ncbi:hypothetical protein GCM10023331_41260 [Algivirga pacifica]|uniref:Uncharacterized protein n=1 Tax=Algivirga pacifica TaxID=1162670 RepID=A0ABP9DNC9_9BACT